MSMTSEKQQQYEKYVKQITPTHSLGLNMLKAFLTGGLICMFGQLILHYAYSLGLDRESAASWCSLILILISVLLTGLNRQVCRCRKPCSHHRLRQFCCSLSY